MTAKSLFMTLLYSGMSRFEAYKTCVAQNIYSKEELQDLFDSFTPSLCIVA